VTSPVFGWPEAGIHELRIVTPAMPVLDMAGDLATGWLQVQFDHHVVWETEVPFFPATSKSLMLAGFGSDFPNPPPVSLTPVLLDIRQERGRSQPLGANP
jgi:hypothetical protein